MKIYDRFHRLIFFDFHKNENYDKILHFDRKNVHIQIYKQKYTD